MDTTNLAVVVHTTKADQLGVTTGMETTQSPLYAAIDLGSNSFHMLIVREIKGSVRTMAKIKQKVRLAAGLDEKGQLNEEAMQRGWDCLALFAERLQDFSANRIIIVATAALRNAQNADIFIKKANQILGHEISIISGEEEARTIYQGVASTSIRKGKCLVIDIGGASTEVIIGKNTQPLTLHSFNMGCVTWLTQHFADKKLTRERFQTAIDAAKAVISPQRNNFLGHKWERCLGASGTIQALQEILLTQGENEEITARKLYRLMDQAIACKHMRTLKINGLTQERTPVFPSGLSILIALFETLDIQSMDVAGGALREGLLHQLIERQKTSTQNEHDPLKKSVTSIQRQFLIDENQAELVNTIAQTLYSDLKATWFEHVDVSKLLFVASHLHELGLSVSFKKHNLHGAYLLNQLTIGGLTQAEKRLVTYLVKYHTGELDEAKETFCFNNHTTNRLVRLFRLSVILAHRRQSNSQTAFHCKAQKNTLSIKGPKDWKTQQPLLLEYLSKEAQKQAKLDWKLTIN